MTWIRALRILAVILAAECQSSFARLHKRPSNPCRAACGWLVPAEAQTHRRSKDRHRSLLWSVQGTWSTASRADSERTVVIAYHKPANVITSHVHIDDPRRTVYQDIERMGGFVRNAAIGHTSSPLDKDGKNTSFAHVTGIRSRYHAIGRLDVDTVGLLLLTNDGGLVHHVTNPTASSHTHNSNKGNKITKTYQALIMGHWEDTHLEPLRTTGVDIGVKHGGLTEPVHQVAILSHPTPKSTLVELTISEGRNRQVRRMFHALGSGVMKLQRIRIGKSLTLDGISQPGQWRILSEEEVRKGLSWEPRNVETITNRGKVSSFVRPRSRTRSSRKRRRS